MAHEVAPGADGPADAELVVAGYSLCYPCGQAFLSRYIDDEPWAAVEILRMFRDGIIDVAP